SATRSRSRPSREFRSARRPGCGSERGRDPRPARTARPRGAPQPGTELPGGRRARRAPGDACGCRARGRGARDRHRSRDPHALPPRARAARGARVTSIEVDAGLVRALEADALLPQGVELLAGDALELDLAALLRAQAPPRRVVANLPYAVAAPLLRRLLDLAP